MEMLEVDEEIFGMGDRGTRFGMVIEQGDPRFAWQCG